MPAVNPRTRVLLRGSLALVAFATLWWFLLLTPLLVVFRNAAQIMGTLAFGSFSSQTGETATSGDWKFWIPVDMAIPEGRPQASRVQSVEFEVPPSGLYTFTFGLPVYWALIAAAPWTRRSARWLIQGTGLTAVLEILLLLIFLKTYAHVLLAESRPPQNQLTDWLYFLAQYLAMNVAPTLTPFGVALFLHRGLRTQILGWVEAQTPDASSPPRAHQRTVPVARGSTGRSRRASR
jgi:hypothetical protein